MIAKLTTHLGYSLNTRYNNKLHDKEILAGNPILDDDKLYLDTFPSGDPLRAKLHSKAFDLYGGSYRFAALPERHLILKSIVLRGKEVEIQNLKDKIECMTTE